jgi:DNA-binding HxlR family transcriptional regulator
MQTAMQLIGGRWKTTIIWYIDYGVIRFGELERAIQGVSKKMLSQQLKELEQDGLVIRKVISEKPLHVEYQLSDLGNSLIPIFAEINKWGEQFRPITSSD